MPTPDTLPFDTLFAPISGEAPTGDDPRKMPALAQKFDALKEAVSIATTVEKQEANSEGALATPPAKLWGPVITQATELLTGPCKDMEVACCLAQALVRTQGLPGLRDGLRLVAGLAERFWDTLHPLPGSDADDDFPEEDAKDDRIRFVEKLQQQSILTALRLAPITSKKGDSFSYSDYAGATSMEMVTKDEDTTEEGRRRKAKIISAATDSGAAFFIALIEDIGLVFGAMDALENRLMEQTGASTLVLGKLRETLDDIRNAVRDISRTVVPDPEPTPALDENGANGANDLKGTAGSGQAGAFGGFRALTGNAAADRDTALHQLSVISTFFKATEPHSPISYTLDTLISRARMPLLTLLEDLIPDEVTRRDMLTRAGIRLPPTE